ncbi:MAG: AAA family ATPase [Candidatus Limnocylindrales bacterium]
MTTNAASSGSPAAAGTSTGPSTWTFMFTDIEGSTRLLQELGDAYAGVLDDQRRLITEAVEAGGGRVFGSEGDALFVAFGSAAAALNAAAKAQRDLAQHEWPPGVELRVRMGIHSGEALLTGGDYVGLSLHQVARITAAGHGGQVLVSEATRRLLSALPGGLELRDLGERRLKDLALPERIHQLIGDGLAERFPPLKTLDTKQNNLPVQVTSFVGRDELELARPALAGTRLLTLTGPGGTGKTRLALQLAAEVSDEFPDGIFFVGLDSVHDPALVSSVIASALGLSVSGTAQPLDAVLAFLGERRVLLVLDNFEQIVDAANDVARILREAPQAKLIVTTRIVLHVYGEQEFPVGPLGLPPPAVVAPTAAEATHYEAVRLFVERAMSVQPSFTLTDENAPAIVEIVRRLDGLPLAIELAAARTRALTVAAIRARLDQHLSLLTGGARDLPQRQQTLRGAIDWSYDLLEPADRRLFERFSVHAGGAFLTQADAVCGPPQELGEDVLDGLTSLADKSLVNPRLGVDDDPRFAMLATIRDYAGERLAAGAELNELARRHASSYLDLVESLSSGLTGLDGARLNDRLEADHDNLRQALEWAIEQGDVQYALRFVTAIWRFWQVRGHLNEASRWLERVFALEGIESQPTEVLADAYEAAGGVHYWRGDTHMTHVFYGRALSAARAKGDSRRIARALYNYGFAPLDQAQPSEQLYRAGRESFDESLELFTEVGDERGIADASWALAIAHAAEGGDRANAVAHSEEALRRYRALGDPFGTGWGAFMVGTLRSRDDGTAVVTPYFKEALQIFSGSRDSTGVLLTLAAIAVLAFKEGNPGRFNILGGAVERLRNETGAGLVDAPLEFVDFTVPDKPTDPTGLSQWESGARMSTEEAVAYALEDAVNSAVTGG